MGLSFPSPQSVHVPTMDAAGRLVIDFSRNERDFPVNRWTRIRPVTKTAGKFLRIDPTTSSRVVLGSTASSRWPAGHPSPSGATNQIRFEYDSYITDRRAKATQLDSLTIQNADFMIQGLSDSMIISQSMTERAVDAAEVLANGDWGANASTRIDQIGAGKSWAIGTPDVPNIKNSFIKVGIAINKSTYGLITPADLVCLINPNTAGSMALAPEITQTFIQSQYGLGYISGSDYNINGEWNIPPVLYRIRLVVDDTIQVTSAIGDTLAQSYVIPDNTAYFLTRLENLIDNGGEETRIVDTVMAFFAEEMTLETKADEFERMFTARVTNDYQYKLISSVSGFKLTGLFD